MKQENQMNEVNNSLKLFLAPEFINGASTNRNPLWLLELLYLCYLNFCKTKDLAAISYSIFSNDIKYLGLDINTSFCKNYSFYKRRVDDREASERNTYDESNSFYQFMQSPYFFSKYESTSPDLLLEKIYAFYLDFCRDKKLDPISYEAFWTEIPKFSVYIYTPYTELSDGYLLINED